MKTYIQPKTQTYSFVAASMLAGSMIKTGDKVSNKVSDGSQKTRENSGFDSGLWSDMK